MRLTLSAVKDSERTVTELLRNFTGLELSPPDRVMRHAWTSDPFSLCGYSYPTLQSQAQDWALLQSPLPSPREPRLLLAGEHTSQHLAGYANGARDTGLDQARRILAFRQERTPDVD